MKGSMKHHSTKTAGAMRLIERFRGVFPAIPTPYTTDDQVDHPALRRLVDYLIDGGVHGIWALGSGGEFPALSAEDRRRVLETVTDQTAGRVPVLGGISSCNIFETERNAHAAADAGVDGVFMIAPYYFHLDAVDIRRYFQRAASASALPLVIYHNSHNSGIRLDVPTVEALSRHENIIGIKDAGCDFALFQAFMTAFADRDDFVVFQGDDTALAAAFLMGCAGTVAALPVIAPRLIVDLFEAGQAGDIRRAHDLQRKGMDLFRVYGVTGEMNDSTFLANQKAALELLGLCTRRPAPPSAPLDEIYLGELQKILTQHGLPIRGKLPVSP
jgi:4-hydroxy-tetrahydrodipicolinate synthase